VESVGKSRWCKLAGRIGALDNYVKQWIWTKIRKVLYNCCKDCIENSPNKVAHLKYFNESMAFQSMVGKCICSCCAAR
jgi:hypothetical protein